MGLAGVSLNQDGFTESQGGPAALSVNAARLSGLQSTVMAQAERRFALVGTKALVQSAEIGWLHEFSSPSGTASAAFVNGAAPFSVRSAPVGRDAALFGAGLRLVGAGPVDFFLAYHCALAANATIQTLSGGISVTW